MSKYFISYDFFLKDGGQGAANMETENNTGITCLDDVKVIEKSILNDNKNYEKVTIKNYIEFPDLRRY